MKCCFKDPEDPDTFACCRLDPSEQSRRPEIVRLHTDLLSLRRADPVLGLPAGRSVRIDGAVLGEACFILRYLTPTQDDRLIVVNFGTGLDLPHLAEPLLGPPARHQWQVAWSSEAPYVRRVWSFGPRAIWRLACAWRIYAAAHSRSR